MKRTFANVTAGMIGFTAGICLLASCVATEDGGTRPATPEEAAVMIETAAPVLAPAAGPYSGLVIAGATAAGILLREWGRQSAAKEAADAKAREDAMFDEGVKRGADGEVRPNEK